MPVLRERLFAGASQACAALVAAAPAAVVCVLLWAAAKNLGHAPTAGPGAASALSSVGRMLAVTVTAGAAAAALGGAFGLACAVVAEELATGLIRALLLAAISALGVMPALVFGWGAAVFVVPFVHQFVPPAFQWFVAAVVVLGAMAVPTSCALVTRALRRVPNRHREAAVAAGAGKVQTVVSVVVPAVRGRIAAAFVAAFARAVGEATALQVVFVWLRLPSGSGVPLAAPWMLTVGASSPITASPAEALAAVALLAVIAVAMLFVDREYRGLQWA